MKNTTLFLEPIQAQKPSQKPLPEFNLVRIAGEASGSNHWQRTELRQNCTLPKRMATDQEPGCPRLLSLPGSPDPRKTAVGGLQSERYAADIPRQCESRKTQEDAPSKFPKKNAIFLRNLGPKLTTDQKVIGSTPIGCATKLLGLTSEILKIEKVSVRFLSGFSSSQLYTLNSRVLGTIRLLVS